MSLRRIFDVVMPISDQAPRNGHIVENERAIPEFDLVARQPDDALHEVLLWVLRIWKNDDVAEPWMGPRFVDEDMVTDHDRRSHRSRRDLERLNDERA